MIVTNNIVNVNFFIFLISSMFFVIFGKIQTGVKWNKQSQNFEAISGLSTYEAVKENVILESRQHEIYNFNGQPLVLTYFEDNGFFKFYDNDTKASGLCGDIWTILANFLNFTLILQKSEQPSIGFKFKNGSYSGILEDARTNKTDIIPKVTVYYTRTGAVEFGPSLWTNSIRIFAYGQWKRNRAWMLTLLSKDVWISIFLFAIILSLASIVTERISILYGRMKMQPEKFIDHLFYCFGTICNQPSNSSNEPGNGSKILNSTICIFGFLTLTAYNSHLIYSMTEESFDAPFENLSSLLDNTNYNIVVLDGSPAYISIMSLYTMQVFQRIRKSQRYMVVTNLTDLYDKVCNNPNKFVMFDAEDAVSTRDAQKCSVIPVGDHYYRIPVTFGVSRRVENRKSLYIGVMKLREYGILNAIKKRYMNSGGAKRVIRYTDSLTVDMDRVAIIFGILFMGMIISIIICIAENLIVRSKKYKTVKCLTKKLPSINRTNLVSSILLPSRRRMKGLI